LASKYGFLDIEYILLYFHAIGISEVSRHLLNSIVSNLVT